MSDGEVRLMRDGAVATILFDRPQARNAMTWRMYEGLAAACAALSSDNGVRVAVLRGVGGKAFIAGTDIAQFQEFTTAEQGVAYEAKMEAYLERARSVADADARGGRRLGDRGRPSYCRLLRSAHRHRRLEIRCADRAHAGQLPIGCQLCAAGSGFGSGARQAHVADGGKSTRRGGAGGGISDGRRRARRRSISASLKSANG